jgi:predicted regulator of Ras-like GTPase activity (Roadblock/LC7/MglB family)
MRSPAPADLQRWSEELARNPASLSFLPLARAHRRNGRRDLAERVCVRGLEHHPSHVEAHALLALLHLEAGDRDRAADEWSTVLRLKPGNFEALRGMGFRYLEQNDLARARQHLERAALIRPNDIVVEEALRLLRQRQESEALEVGPRPPPEQPSRERVVAEPTEEWREAMTERRDSARPDWLEIGPEPAAPEETVVEPDWLRPRPPPADSFPFEIVAPPGAPEQVLDLDHVADADTGAASEEEPWAATPSSGAVSGGTGADAYAAEHASLAVSAPHRLFADLLQGAPLLGALLLDRRGLVLAGSLREELGGGADALGAILGGAIEEAVRTAAHLELGAWRVMLLETASAVVHVSPVADRGILVLAATHAAPTGWILRTAAYAAERAARFLEETT